MPEYCRTAGSVLAKAYKPSLKCCVNLKSQTGFFTIRICSLSKPRSLLLTYCICRLMTNAAIINTTQQVYCSTTSILENLGVILNVWKLLIIDAGFILEMSKAG